MFESSTVFGLFDELKNKLMKLIKSTSLMITSNNMLLHRTRRGEVGGEVHDFGFTLI